MPGSLLNKTYKITQTLCSNLVMVAQLEACWIEKPICCLKQGRFLFCSKVNGGRDGELSRYALPVLTEGILFFYAFYPVVVKLFIIFYIKCQKFLTTHLAFQSVRMS
jgi:hypothetical protein